MQEEFGPKFSTACPLKFENILDVPVYLNYIAVILHQLASTHQLVK